MISVSLDVTPGNNECYAPRPSPNPTQVPEGGWFTIAVSMGVALIKFLWLSGQLAKKKALQE